MAIKRGVVLAVLTASLTLSYVDRYLIAVLIEPIKADLHLSDSQIGLVTGFAFAAFYAILGLPLARLADRGWHRAVICGSILVWSAMTALTGFASSFVHMAVARFGVGAGEAGVFPTSQAIIAETYPADRRTTPMAIFAAGGSLGLLLAFALGSWVEARVGWRWTFVFMAMPGLILAPLAYAVLPGKSNGAVSQAQPASLRELWRNPHFRHLPFVQSATVVLLFGQAQWLPAFFERSFGVDRVVLGATLGLTQGIATIAGAVTGGVVADRLRRKSLRWPLKLVQLSLLIAIFPMVLLFAFANLYWAIFLAAVTGFLFSMPAGPIVAHLSQVVRPDQRASATAGAIMIASLLGIGGGPLLIGGASDLLVATTGRDSLRYALLLVGLLAIGWGAWHLDKLNRLPITATVDEGCND